jgi:hypothetical protein
MFGSQGKLKKAGQGLEGAHEHHCSKFVAPHNQNEPNNNKTKPRGAANGPERSCQGTKEKRKKKNLSNTHAKLPKTYIQAAVWQRKRSLCTIVLVMRKTSALFF